MTFEKGIHLLGGQSILFPGETLDKREDLRDVCGYLNNWADMMIVRHREIGLIERLADYSGVPVINAMTAIIPVRSCRICILSRNAGKIL